MYDELRKAINPLRYDKDESIAFIANYVIDEVNAVIDALEEQERMSNVIRLMRDIKLDSGLIEKENNSKYWWIGEREELEQRLLELTEDKRCMRN